MENKIPKIIHYCWFGDNELPKLSKECIESWRKYLPDYKIILWNEKNFDISSNKFTKAAYNAKKWAFITDYIRLYALYTIGGIYLDTDVEIVKNIDIFLNDEAFSGFEDEKMIPTGIIGSKKGNLWIKRNLEYYKEYESFTTTPNTKIITEISLKEYGLILNNKKQILKNQVTIYPKEYFCPKSHYTEKIEMTSKTYAIHHFSGSWLSNYQKLKKHFIKLIIIFISEKKYIQIKKILGNSK